MENDLSIFIPTFNRKSKLINLLQILNSNIPLSVSVNIINNASTDNTREAISMIENSLDYKINYFENVVNIGGNPNIIRCIEYCKTQWLWILGDDDLPIENCVDLILKNIKLYTNAVYINFQTTISLKHGDKPEDSDVISKGQNGLVNNMKSFPNILFISSGIYKVSEIKKNIKAAYFFNYSCAPQTAILLDYLGDYPLAETVYSTSYLCNWEAPALNDKWDDSVVNASLSDILFVVRNKEDKINLFNKINLYHPYHGFTKKDVLSSLVDQSSSRREIAINYFSSQFFKTWVFEKEIDKELLNSICINFLIFFSRFKIFRMMLKLITGRTNFNKVNIYNRFASFKTDKRL